MMENTVDRQRFKFIFWRLKASYKFCNLKKFYRFKKLNNKHWIHLHSKRKFYNRNFSTHFAPIQSDSFCAEKSQISFKASSESYPESTTGGGWKKVSAINQAENGFGPPPLMSFNKWINFFNSPKALKVFTAKFFLAKLSLRFFFLFHPIKFSLFFLGSSWTEKWSRLFTEKRLNGNKKVNERSFPFPPSEFHLQ